MGALVAGRPTNILHLAPWLNRPPKKGNSSHRRPPLNTAPCYRSRGALRCPDAAPARSGACRHFSSLRGISAATACEIGAGEAPPGKIKHFSSVNPARGKALRPRLGHPLSQERGAVNDL